MEKIVYTWAGGIYCIFVQFSFAIVVLGSGGVPIGSMAPWRFKMLGFQYVKSNIGPVSISVHTCELLSKSCHGIVARYLLCFRPGASNIPCSFFCRGREVVRRTVMQIRGGITSGSNFAVFILIANSKMSFVFEGPPFPASVPPKKCTRNMSVNRLAC